MLTKSTSTWFKGHGIPVFDWKCQSWIYGMLGRATCSYYQVVQRRWRCSSKIVLLCRRRWEPGKYHGSFQAVSWNFTRLCFFWIVPQVCDVTPWLWSVYVCEVGTLWVKPSTVCISLANSVTLLRWTCCSLTRPCRTFSVSRPFAFFSAAPWISALTCWSWTATWPKTNRSWFHMTPTCRGAPARTHGSLSWSTPWVTITEQSSGNRENAHWRDSQIIFCDLTADKGTN